VSQICGDSYGRQRPQGPNSRYGTLKAWASKLALEDAVKLLDQILTEEKKTDDALTKLADTAVNAEAA
jgi:ferritin-like metal-binding protein YciE